MATGEWWVIFRGRRVGVHHGRRPGGIVAGPFASQSRAVAAGRAALAKRAHHKPNPRERVRELNRLASWPRLNDILGERQEIALANNTRVVRLEESDIGVILHRTVIARFSRQHAGRVTLYSGGYHTSTTKQRINQLLPPGWHLEQSRFEWYLRNRRTGQRFDFEEGIAVSAMPGEPGYDVPLTPGERDMGNPDSKLYAVAMAHERGGLQAYIAAIPVGWTQSHSTAVIMGEFQRRGITTRPELVRIVEARSERDAKRAYEKMGVASGFPLSNPGGDNPPTRAAQRFISRKIRTLAHEGMEAPRRIAAAYSMARRRGFRSVPRRPNPGDVHVDIFTGANARHPVGGHRVTPGTVTRRALHRPNPLLTVLGNPGSGAVQTISHNVRELSYVHTRDPEGSDVIRHHRFKPGACMTLLQDGRVVLWRRDGRPLWVDDGEGDA